jgi:uncharacterized protein (DUF305 family)
MAVALAILLAAAAGYAVGTRADRHPGASSVDVGFLRDMIDHHEQAVRMSLIELSNGGHAIPRNAATDVLAAQRYEIGLMEERLHDWGYPKGAPTRRVMGWMGMAVPLPSMPGLASPAQLQRFAAAKGADADGQFLQLMIVHHQGGIHMAEYAAAHASDERVRDLADYMARQQSLEIGELKAGQTQLGLPQTTQ